MEEILSFAHKNFCVYIFSDNEDAIDFIKEFQTLLKSKNLYTMVALTPFAFSKSLGVNNCYVAENYIRWADLCLSSDKVVALRLIEKPTYSPEELFNKMAENIEYRDQHLEFFEY